MSRANDDKGLYERELRSRLIAFNAWVKDHFLATLITVKVAGFLIPQPGDTLRHLNFFNIPLVGWSFDFSTFALILLMLSASIQCDTESFKGLRTRRHVGLLALASFYAVVPLVSFFTSLAATVFLGANDATYQLQLGFLFIAVMPVAVTSAFWVRLNEGYLPIVFPILMLSSGLAAMTVPFFLHLMVGSEASTIRVPVSMLIQQLVLTVTLPLIVGVGVRAKNRQFVERWQPAVTFMGNLGLLAIVWMSVATARPQLTKAGEILLAAAILTFLSNLAYYWCGIGLARIFGLWREDAIALVFTSGMRNYGASMVVGMASFPEMPLATLPATLFGLSQHIIGGFLTRSFSRADGGVLGAAIGTDAGVLEHHVVRIYEQAAQRGPRATLGVFKFAEASDAARMSHRSVLAFVRGHLRSTDYVCAIPPDGFVVVLQSNVMEDHAAVLDRILRDYDARFPRHPLSRSVVQSIDHKYPMHLIEAAFDRLAAPASPAGDAATPASPIIRQRAAAPNEPRELDRKN